MTQAATKQIGVLLLGLVLQASVGLAEDPPPAGTLKPSRIPAQEIPWPQRQDAKQEGTSMRQGLQILVITGDAKRHELYSMLFKVPPNITIPPHSHPDERSCFVLSGAWYFAYGAERNEGELALLPAGSHYTEPAGMNHFAATRAEGATVECTAMGPTGTTFVNPADDPRAKQ
jgi:quercetin dioxygenase-like cupin family protein